MVSSYTFGLTLLVGLVKETADVYEAESKGECKCTTNPTLWCIVDPAITGLLTPSGGNPEGTEGTAPYSYPFGLAYPVGLINLRCT